MNLLNIISSWLDINESATIPKFKKFRELNKGLIKNIPQGPPWCFLGEKVGCLITNTNNSFDSSFIIYCKCVLFS